MPLNSSFYVDDGYLVIPDLSVATDINNTVSLDYAFIGLNNVAKVGDLFWKI